MPMIEFRYAPECINPKEAVLLNNGLEGTLRNAIKRVRDNVHEYGVTVEGDPFRLKQNQPMLRIYVFYHQEWNFTPEELELLPITMGDEVYSLIKDSGLHDVTGKIRFYERAGHASSLIQRKAK